MVPKRLLMLICITLFTFALKISMNSPILARSPWTSNKAVKGIRSLTVTDEPITDSMWNILLEEPDKDPMNE